METLVVIGKLIIDICILYWLWEVKQETEKTNKIITNIIKGITKRKKGQ